MLVYFNVSNAQGYAAVTCFSDEVCAFGFRCKLIIAYSKPCIEEVSCFPHYHVDKVFPRQPLVQYVYETVDMEELVINA